MLLHVFCYGKGLGLDLGVSVPDGLCREFPGVKWNLGFSLLSAPG